MNEKQDLSYMESLYMALADKTRLRLLSLMRDREVCVGSFTDLLGDSQPKISRHLAYLRNAGVVQTRRDGKWMYYSIRWPDDSGKRGLLLAALNWLAQGQEVDEEVRIPVEIPGRRIASKRENRRPDDIISAQANVDEEDDFYPTEEPAHNELEEFLL
jgi:ArsR family transcriptional regulator, arsenate/arsenite/antimonite-responsive transcriptional repressor